MPGMVVLGSRIMGHGFGFGSGHSEPRSSHAALRHSCDSLQFLVYLVLPMWIALLGRNDCRLLFLLEGSVFARNIQTFRLT
jgi:hypothetical protein